MITKREKLQYIYVFLTDLLVLLLSTLLAWLVTDGLLNQLVPYAPSDWVQTICLLMLAFVATFICFDQTENIVARTSGEEIKLSIKFNVLLALVYSTAMLLTKARMRATSRWRCRLSTLFCCPSPTGCSSGRCCRSRANPAWKAWWGLSPPRTAPNC